MLVKLATAIAAAASLTRTAEQAVLFAHAAFDGMVPVDANTGKPAAYGTLRIFTGIASDGPTSRVAVQLLASAPFAVDAISFAESVHNALIYPAEHADGPGLERRGWAIDGYVLDIFNLQPPALIGVDEQERPKASLNFEVAYYATT